MDSLSWAIGWHNRGFCVIPVHFVTDDGACSCADPHCGSPGKHPALRSWSQYQERRPTVNTLESWFEAGGRYHGYNIGVVTGQVSGNVFVPDVDVGPGKVGLESLQDLILSNEDLPETIEQKTGGGGIHFFFRAPPDIKVVTDKNVLGPDIDVRGEGGFVVVTPSNHHSGGRYEIREGCGADIADAPQWLLSMVTNDEYYAADTGFQSDSVNRWGEYTDGREGYMTKLLMGCIRSWWVEKGDLPQVDDLILEAWPTYTAKVAARGQSLDADGRGEKLMRKKAQYLISKADQGKLRILQGVEPGSEPKPEKPAKTIEVPRQKIILEDHYLKTYVGEPPPLEWIIEGILPRGITGLVAGSGGIGKSYLMLDTALRVAGGDQGMHQEYALGGKVLTNGKVVYITAEDSRNAVHRRIASIKDPTLRERANENLIVLALPDLGGAFPLLVNDFGTYRATEAYADLREQLLKIQNLALIIKDPLQPFTSADVNSDPAAAQAWWSNFNELSTATGASVLVTHHMRKDGTFQIRTAAQARESIRGTTGLVDGPRVVIAIWVMPEQEQHQLSRHFGFEPGQGAAVCWAVVKANDQADLDVHYGIRAENGLIVDRTGEIMEILEDNRNLEDGQVEQIFSEIRRRWDAENPFSIGNNTPRSFMGYLKNEFGMTSFQAKMYLQTWLDRGNIEDAVCNKKKHMKGIRIVTEPVESVKHRTYN